MKRIFVLLLIIFSFLGGFFLRNYLPNSQAQPQTAAKAILAGIPIKGFFVWTLMDNYEWELGHKPGSNFGLVHIDRTTLKRTPKKSYYWYKQVVKNRVLA